MTASPPAAPSARPAPEPPPHHSPQVTSPASPGGPDASGAPGGRREANKARTRAALVAAVFELVETEGVEAVTAERVADAAGISRRTFFNYFSSVDAVIAHGAEEVLEKIRAALPEPTEGADLADTAYTVIEQVITVDLLRGAHRAWSACRRSPSARRYALEAHDARIAALAHGWAAHHLPAGDDDPLRAAVLAATLLTAFDEARRHWLDTQTGPIDEAARARLLTIVRRALDLVRPAFAPA